MAQFDFSGLWIPLVTPLRDGRVDETALRRLVRHLAESGASGFIPCGSTGEAHSLSLAEQLLVLETVISAAHDKPVVMGLAGTQAAEMTDRLHQYTRAGAQGVLLSAPYYLRPSQAGLLAHFRQLADAATVPVALYDVPARTGATLSLETLLALADHPRVVAIKDCGGDAEKTRALIADGRLAVLAGNDDAIFATLSLGGAGAIAASGHVMPKAFARLVAALRDARMAEARQLWHALAPLTQALFAEPNPSAFKAVLAHEGWMASELRAPHSPASREGLQRALGALAAARQAVAA